MKMTKMYKEIDGEIKSCNCEDVQLKSMKKHGWKDQEPKDEQPKVEEKPQAKSQNSSKLK